MYGERIARHTYTEAYVDYEIRRHHHDWGLSAPTEWARWEGTGRDRRSIEIDVAAELDDGKLLTSEIKWSSKPIDLDVHVDHRNAIRAVAESGRRWAYEALESEHSHGHL